VAAGGWMLYRRFMHGARRPGGERYEPMLIAAAARC
jgi:hypothetical protein